MHIRDWPHEERPREKLLARGAGSLSDAELLAIFLGSGLHGRDAVATARELLAQHGPLRALLERPPSELTTLPGLGPARACALAGALELGNRLLHASLERGDAISDPEAAGRYFAQRLRGRRQEVFAALFLDTRHRVLGFEELFQGSVDSAEVHPREVARRPLDAVARFHLGNGARVERLNWLGDPSPKGLKQSYGLMVNYLYDLKRLDKHRALLAQGKVPVSGAMESLQD